MKNTINILWITLLILFPLLASAQSLEYTLDDSSTMVIAGTSTLHDWEADVNEMDISVSLDPERMDGENPQAPVTSLALNAAVKSMESGKGKMNRKMYEALKEDDHPEIMFNLLSAELSDTAQTAESFMMNVTGNLNVAGNLKEVSFPVKGTMAEDGSYRFEGSYSLNMKDYDVDPPSVMFGTIKSGEEVTIRFNILLTTTTS